MSNAEALLTVEEFANRCKIGRTTVFLLIKAGEVRSVKIRRRRLIPTIEVPAFIQRKLEEASRG